MPTPSEPATPSDAATGSGATRPEPTATPAQPDAARAANGRAFRWLGVVATCTAMAMYVAYVPQIVNNLHGHKSGALQPLVAAVNCTLWVTYGLIRKPSKDLPVAIANAPGVLFGLAAFATAL